MSVPLCFAGAYCGFKTVDKNDAKSIGCAFLSGLPAAVLLLLIPLIPITICAAFVKNCNYLIGLAFFALLSGVATLQGIGLGCAIAKLFKKKRFLIFSIGYILSLVPPLYRLWTEPPVDAFGWLLPYFPGPIYDEFVPISARLLISRFEDVIFVAAIMALAEALKRVTSRNIIIFFCFSCASVAARGWANTALVHRDAASIAQELGRTVETSHLRIYMPKSWSTRKTRQMALELEFAAEELRDFFGFYPSQKIEAFLYPNQNSKKQLMGAGNTRVSKPWQRALHIQAPAVGDDVTIHELAHAFSADWSDGPTYLPTRYGFLPQMALIEGLAEAAEWSGTRLTLHEWAAASKRLNKSTKIRKLLSPTGFYAKSSSMAYTLAGSFVRYFYDTHGAEALAKVYREGTFANELAQLEEKWQAFLSDFDLSETALEAAKARFDRPAIFGKTCAHEIAALRKTRSELKGEAALAVNCELLGHTPRDPEARLTEIGLLLQLDREDEALAAAESLASDPKIGATWRRRAELTLADLKAFSEPENSFAVYQNLMTHVFDRNTERALAVRLAQRERPIVGAATLALMRSPLKDAISERAAFESLLALEPTDGLLWYLYGLRLKSLELEDFKAESAFEIALDLGLPNPALELEARRRLADLSFKSGDYKYSKQQYQELANCTQGAEKLNFERWVRRVAFFEAHASEVSELIKD